jgi:predicted glycosyltransferase
MINSEKNSKIIVAPLDWGLGHASRCIPIIKNLLAENQSVVIASSGLAMDLLRKEFPNLEFIELPSYNIKYSKSITFSIAKKFPALLDTIQKENELIADYVKKNDVKKIISDNRYGCYNENIESVIIIHQLNLKLPPLLQSARKIIDRFHKKHLSNFNKIWIPDYENHLLSGDLSKSLFHNIEFIGPLSRFEKSGSEVKKEIAVLAVLSGPEPSRTKFEKILIEELKDVENSMVVRGIKSENEKIGKLDLIGLADSRLLNDLINKSEILIMRSGYSSIMDLNKLERNAVLVPTPGQTEQIYLAERLMKENLFFSCKEEDFSLELVKENYGKFKGFAK